jgi:hypothetical protein
MVKTKKMIETEKRLGKPLEEVLPETYERLGSLETTGKALAINPNTLYDWLLRLGYTRKVSLVKGDLK